MLTKLRIRNFKRFEDTEIELGRAVAFVGPNNSGKTTALQALALWDIGLRTWLAKRKKSNPAERAGVAVNRRDILSIPAPDTQHFWRDLHVRSVKRVGAKQDTQNIRIEIIVDGVSNDEKWECGLEFDFANSESIYCRPLRFASNEPMQIPAQASQVRVAYLPPMSGLAAVEPKLEAGRVNVLLGEGQSAQVLRNLCHAIYTSSDPESWNALVDNIRSMFGAEILPPDYVAERGEIAMSYRENNGVVLDLSSSGRGLQQTLLLLAHLYANPNTVLMLDEPDAHLEILRQRQIYQLLSETARKRGSQIVIASHSEVVLNEAAGRDVVVAFVGKPHRLDDRGSQVLKSLTKIGFDQYAQAEQTGWVLYLEGSTDLAILQTFARKLNHEAQKYLERPFVKYVLNNPNTAKEHFYGLQEAKNDFVGVAIFDRIESPLEEKEPLSQTMWKKRELENYFCTEGVLLAYAGGKTFSGKENLPQTDIFADVLEKKDSQNRIQIMKESIDSIGEALRKLKKADPWGDDIKSTDDFLDPLFEEYYERLRQPNLLRKTSYYTLAELMPTDEIDPEISEKLDLIVKVAKMANRNSESE